jgi:hypothetical protein
MFKSHYFDETPHNEGSQRGDRNKRTARRRRRTVSAKSIRFTQLKPLLAERAGQIGWPALASITNCDAALADFLRERELAWDDVVGDLLRDGFNVALESHKQALRNEGRKASYIGNRASAMQHWHLLARALDHEGAAIDGTLTPLQRALRGIFADGTRLLTPTAKSARIPWATLKDWLNGRVPRPGMEDKLERLERVSNRLPNSLIDLLPYRPRRRAAGTSIENQPSEHRQRMKKLTADPYRLATAHIPPAVYSEWRKLLEDKTGVTDSSSPMIIGSRLSNIIAKARAAAERAATDGNEDAEKGWRLRELRSDELAVNRKNALFIIDGQFCPTAKIDWGKIKGFLGWAMRSTALGGAGLKDHELTLGLFADYKLVVDYVSWRIRRSESINNGHKAICGLALMLLNPKTGFLPQQAAIGERYGISDFATWQTHCMTAHAKILAYKAKIAPEVRKSRDPAKELELILKRPAPLEAFAEGVTRLESTRPTTGGRDETLWARDVLLLMLPMSNPLRLENLRSLTYRDDNTGHLRRQKNGSYDIFIDRREFKNIHGAAKNEDYHQDVDPSVWTYLDRFLKTYRPLFKNKSDHLFVTHTSSAGRWTDEAMGKHYKKITQRWVSDCPNGTGPHGIRHVVTTQCVLDHMSDAAIAELLHDDVTTMKRSYSHTIGALANKGRTATVTPIMRRICINFPQTSIRS